MSKKKDVLHSRYNQDNKEYDIDEETSIIMDMERDLYEGVSGGFNSTSRLTATELLREYNRIRNQRLDYIRTIPWQTRHLVREEPEPSKLKKLYNKFIHWIKYDKHGIKRWW